MFTRLLLVFALCTTLAHAAENPPSEESVRALINLTEARRLLDNVLPQVNAMLQNSVREASKNQSLTPEAQKLMEKSLAETQAAMQEMLTWERLEAIYVRIYRRTLTQEEVDGMIEFYKTPVGQAVLKKMPMIMQNTMMEVQTMLLPLAQRLQEAQREAVEKSRAEQNSAEKCKKKK